ncbi:MAG: hypothetical protein A3E87_00880 [Gammaproteobacteria bacterium RIFCSPHIGHO2_12_FULL_35_23]|nr:MAG: hypothetical protein A3E87_00880 [Gammaproteobacteria bacterium RIFCSPHIGHO2_12_FULL_35_23]
MKFCKFFFKTHINTYRELPLIGWQGLTLGFIECTVSGIIYFLLLYFVNTLHFTLVVAGGFITAYCIGASIGGLSGGILTDKLGSFYISILGLFISGMVYLSLTLLTSKLLLMVVMLMLGIASYMFKTANNVFLLNSCNEIGLKEKVVSMLNAAVNLGIAVSVLLVSFFSHYGYKKIFLIAGFILIFAAGYLFKSKQAKENAMKKFKEKKQLSLRIQFLSLKKSVFFVLGWLFFIGLIVAQLRASYPLYVHNTFSTLGAKSVGILFAINTLFIVLFQLPITEFFRRFRKIILMGCGGFLIGIGMFMLYGVSSYLIAILACLVYTMGEIIFFPNAQLICFETSDTHSKGFIVGLYRSIYATSLIIGPVLGMLIYNQFAANLLWLLCGVIGCFCLIACWFYNHNLDHNNMQ